AADCVLVNGHIVTLDPARPRATALAIVSDRIVAVAGDREIRRLRDRRTRVVDLRGATVVPGLVDAPAHLDREGRKCLYPALARAGVTRATVAPKGGEILKDAAGEPTGVLVEHNLVQVLEFTLMRVAPRFTHADRLTALGDSQRRYAARGVTAIYEGHGVAP